MKKQRQAPKATEHPIAFKDEMVRAILRGQKTQTRRLVRRHQNCIAADGRHISKALWNDLDWSQTSVAELPRGLPALAVFVYKSESSHWRGGFASITPKVRPGHTIWVREAWGHLVSNKDGVIPPVPTFRADWLPDNAFGVPAPTWRPGMYLKKKDARLWLTVVKVRLERLQDISEQDCVAEGVRLPVVRSDDDPSKVRPLVRLTGKHPPSHYLPKTEPVGSWTTEQIMRAEFASLWDGIHGGKDGDMWEDNPWVWIYEWEPIEGNEQLPELQKAGLYL